MAEDKDSELFFVGIKNESEIKRNILETMKSLLQALQKYEDFKKVRYEKNKATYELMRLMKEIGTLISKLKVSLPKSNMHIKPPIQPAKLESQEKALEKAVGQLDRSQKIAEKKEEKLVRAEIDEKTIEKEFKIMEDTEKIGTSDIEKMESELADIEYRLRNI